MKLTKITSQGLKGRDVTVEIPPLAAIYGDNATGKTALRDALSLAVLGYVPEMTPPSAKPGGSWTHRAGAMMALASSPKMAASATFDDGLAIDRSWRADGSSTKTDLRVRGAQGPKAAEAAITTRLGDPEALELLLSAQAFLAMSSAKRREYLGQRAGAMVGGVTVDQARQMVMDALEECGLRLTPEKMGRLLPKQAPSLDAWLCVALADARSVLSGAKKATTKAAALLEDARAKLSAAAVTPDEAKARLDELIAERQRAQALAEGSPREQVRKLQAKLSSAQDRRAQAFAALAECPGFDADEIDIAEYELRERADQITEASAAVAEADSRHSEAVADLATARAELKALSQVLHLHAGGGACPTCRRPVDDDEAAILEVERTEATEAVDSAEARLKEAAELKTELAKTLERGRKAQSELAARISRMYETRNASRQRGALETAVADAEAEAAELVAQIAELRERSGDTDWSARVVELSAEIGELQDTVGSAERLAREVGQYESELKTLESDREAAVVVVDVLGSGGVQGQLAEAVSEALVGRANALVTRCGLGRLEVETEDEQGRPILEIMLDTDGLRRPVSVLCGGEAAVALAAISTGLADLLQAKWRPVLIDGVESIDLRRRLELMATLSELLQRGEIDQAILSGCPDIPEIAGGFELQVLG